MYCQRKSKRAFKCVNVIHFSKVIWSPSHERCKFRSSNSMEGLFYSIPCLSKIIATKFCPIVLLWHVQNLVMIWYPATDLHLSQIHYNDVIMSAMASQITSLTIIYSIVYSGADEKKTSKLRVTGLCVGNSPVTGEFPSQRVSNAENVSIWRRHHVA